MLGVAKTYNDHIWSVADCNGAIQSPFSQQPSGSGIQEGFGMKISTQPIISQIGSPGPSSEIDLVEKD